VGGGLQRAGVGGWLHLTCIGGCLLGRLDCHGSVLAGCGVRR
jgi:hypothetical protein